MNVEDQFRNNATINVVAILNCIKTEEFISNFRTLVEKGWIPFYKTKKLLDDFKKCGTNLADM